MILVAFFSFLSFAGCASSEKSTAPGIGSEYRLDDIWVLQNLGPEIIHDSNFVNGLPRMEIKVNAMVFDGTTGCNDIKGFVSATSETIKFSNISTTKTACPGDYEQKLLDALEQADSYVIENNRLFLSSGPVVVLVFRKVD